MSALGGLELEHLRQELRNSEPREAIGDPSSRGHLSRHAQVTLHCKEHPLGAKGNGKNPDKARASPLHL
jgi:hypothetical protein